MNAFTEQHLKIGGYPHEPGYKVDGTSKDAARAVGGGAPGMRREVMRRVVAAPATADEIAAAMGRRELAIRPRVSELRKLEMLTEHRDAKGRKVRRPNESGNLATVWEATERGRAALAEGRVP